MKRILFLVLSAMLLCGTVDAQSFLKKIGKAVEKGVTKELNKVVKDVKQSLAKETDSQHKEQPTEAVKAEPTRRVAPAPQRQIIVDKGENIPREAGLDYIDEYGINHGGGILIGDVLWAPVNCGYHATDYPYGKLFQWGRRHGQGYGEPYGIDKNDALNPDKTTANIVPAPVTPAEARKHPNNFYAKSINATFNWTRNDMKLWNNFTDDGIVFKNTDNDPCPKGWRLPELFDFYSLVENFSPVAEYPEGGPKGRWFSGPKPYGESVPRIFLPLVGMRKPTGESYARDVAVRYWSLRHGGGEGLVWHLFFNTDPDRVEVVPSALPHEGYAVRCVKDIKGQRMK